MGMSTKRTYGKAFGVPVQTKPFKPFPQNTRPMVLYRTPSQYKSLTNPPQGRIWPEKKNVDVTGSIGAVAIGAWSEVDLLNGIPNGANAIERIGRNIQLKSLLVRWNQSSSASVSPIRILIIYDREAAQTIPTITEILQNNSFNSPMALANSDRFVVIHDEISISNAQVANVTRADKIYKKLNLPQKFATAGGTVADITHGAVYIMCCCVNTPIGSGIGYQSRIRFTDV